MSFDIFLERFESAGPTEAANALVLQVLHARQHSGPDQFGFYEVVFSDGASVEFSAKGLESDSPFSGCAFFVRSFSDQLVEFIFAIAQAGRMAILPVMAEGLVVSVHEDILHRIPPAVLEDLKLVEVRSAVELKALLVGGFDDWSKFRDQINRSI